MMNQVTRRAFGLLFSFTMGLMPCLVVGQTTGSAHTDTDVSDSAIDEVVVLANYLPTPQQLVGSSISVLDTSNFAARSPPLYYERCRV
jgi:hypothetical protein